MTLTTTTLLEAITDEQAHTLESLMGEEYQAVPAESQLGTALPYDEEDLYYGDEYENEESAAGSDPDLYEDLEPALRWRKGYGYQEITTY
jgi:hypothetical protein